MNVLVSVGNSLIIREIQNGDSIKVSQVKRQKSPPPGFKKNPTCEETIVIKMVDAVTTETE